MDEFDIAGIAREFLRLDVATHQRQCAIRQGVRETDKVNCDHEWCEVRRWCIHCGQTQMAVYFGK